MMIEKRAYTAMVDGEDLHVCRLGTRGDSGQDPTLVFLHEALGSVAQWRDFPELLSAKCALPALIYDRCGFGLSQPKVDSRGEGYLTRDMESLKSLLDDCSIEQAVLVGHSDGATLALLFAAAFPERVAAVVSEAAHLFVEDETLAGINAAVQRWKNTDFRRRLERYHGLKTEQVFWNWAGTWLDPAFRRWNIEAEVARVSCPVLAIQGGDDGFGTVRQLDTLCTLVGGPHVRCLIDDCGHVPHHQAREEVLDEMARFVAGLDSCHRQPE